MPRATDETARAGWPPASRVLLVAAGMTPVLLGVLHGGYFAGTWLTLGAAGGAVFLMVRAAGGPRHPWFHDVIPRAAVVAMACLALFAMWNLASALWATNAAAAALEGTRSFLYLFALAATLTVVRDNRDARVLLSALALSSAVVALVTIVSLALSGSPENYFRFFKLNEPVGYYNAEAAFFAIPALVSLHLASRLSTSRPLRPLLFAAGVVLLEAGVLTQSRGGFWAFAAAVAVYIALVPNRPRTFLWWGIAFAIVALAFSRLNAPHIDLREHDIDALMQSSRGVGAAVSASMAAALAAAAALVALEARVVVGRRGSLLARAAAGAVALAAVVFLLLSFPALRNPVHALDAGWAQFKGSKSTSSDVRILDLSGSRRYELWQVAWRAFEESPGRGVGADNYVIEWNRWRPLAHDVKQPHNLYLRLLAEVGVPGLALFLAAVAIALGNGVYTAWRRSQHDRALAACLAAACTAFLVHAAAEWVWHVPAVAVTFFVMLGLLLNSGAREYQDTKTSERADPAAGRPPRPAARVVARVTPLTLTAALGLAVVVLTTPQLISDRLEDRATSLLAQGEPALARQAATWSARSNPLSGAPYVVMGKAAAAEGDVPGAEEAFLAATRKNPADWHAYVLWGDTIREAGVDATPLYARAAELNPLSYDVKQRMLATGP
ncbi:MAG: O-antigen ligase family protein [Thermoleophilia bacterium]